MQAWMVEIKHNLKKRLKVPIFLEVLFAMEAMKVTQSDLEEKGNPCILKYEFSLAKRPIYFHISSTITFKPTNKTSCDFPEINDKVPTSVQCFNFVQTAVTGHSFFEK